MRFPFPEKLTGTFAVTGLLITANAVFAASDAGSQIRRYQDETLRRLTPAPTENKILTPEQPSRSKAAASASNERIRVAAFQVNGVTRFTQEEVSGILKPFVGKELDTNEIHRAADELNRFYRTAGYFTAKVFIPPQNVADVIVLDVYEGYLDSNGIEVINKGKRIDASVVQGILQTNLKPEQPIQRANYERALLIAEDLPGVTTSSMLYPGEYVGTARLRTTLTDLPLFSGNVDIDNFGAESTGQTRLGTTLYLNSPTLVGDQLVARLVTSGSRSNYAYLTYLRPISSYGTRLGASVDYFGYDADHINNLGYSNGHATDMRLYLTHPIIRSRHGNLNLRSDLSQLNINDSNDLQINGKRHINTLSVALQGDDDHAWMGAGLTIFNTAITTGVVAVEGNTAYRNRDDATVRTDGGFTRLNLNVSRLQYLNAQWSIFGRLSGQWASTNLDSSQKFYLGGATSISGYPVGEASGDAGAEAHLELRRDFVAPWNGTLTAGLFYQYGWVKNHENTWPGWQGSNPVIQNDITLKSFGLSASTTLDGAWVARALVGRQTGANNMRDPSSGEASDGSTKSYRVWFQVIRYF